MAYQHLDQIWLFGDSLTEGSFAENGIGARFADTYVRKLDVINRGYYAHNSRWNAIILKQILPNIQQLTHQNLPKIRLMTIWLGSNDSVRSDSPFHVSLPDFNANMTEIISLIRVRSPETRIILITPGPCQVARVEATLYAALNLPNPPARSNALVKPYVDAVLEIGAKMGIPVVDTWSAIWAAAGSNEDSALEPFFTDGLHLAAPGYKLVWDLLFKTIKTNYPELHPDATRMDFVAWNEVDPSKPEKSLQRRDIDTRSIGRQRAKL